MATKTVREAAAELGVNAQTVRSAIESGYIAAQKEHLGALRFRWLLSEEAIARYRERHLGQHRRGGRVADHEEDARMAAAGYLKVVAAARELGVDPRYLGELIRKGRATAERRHILFIHRDEVLRLKAERAAKVAALVEKTL